MPCVNLNDHDMYYEIHGSGEHAVCSGGWGTFCHGESRHLPRGLTERYKVLVFDHRGIGQSSDDSNVPATTELYADDVAALLQHLDWPPIHMIGIVGIGSCIGQELALRHPERVRSLAMSGTWAKTDAYFDAQLDGWLSIHKEQGFDAFQQAVVLASFDPDFYNENKDRLLGANGGWSDLRDNVFAHARFTQAAKAHDTLARLAKIDVPALVIHNHKDTITAPRLTRPVADALSHAQIVDLAEAAHVVTGRELKKRFCDTLFEFLSASG